MRRPSACCADGGAAGPADRPVRPRAYGDGVTGGMTGRQLRQAALLLAAAAVALAFPGMVNNYWLSVGITALFYAIVAASWALLVGYAGQFSFGQMAFVSMGAYTSGMLVRYLDVPIPLGIAGRHRAVRADRLRHRLCLPAHARSLSRAVHRRVLRSACASSSSRRPRSPAALAGWKSRRCSTPAPTRLTTISFLALLAGSLVADGPARALALGPVLPRHPRERGRRRGGRREGGALPRCWPSPSPPASPASPAASTAITSASSRPTSARSIRWAWWSPWR